MRGLPGGLRPLLPWLVAATALASGAVGVAAALGRWAAPPSAEFLRFNSGRLDSFERRSRDGAFRVVLLGDSRLKYATYEARELEARLATELGRPAEVVRIVNDFGVFADFAPLAGRIAAIEPQLVILQQDLLWADRTWRLSARLLGGDLWSRALPDEPVPDFHDAVRVQFGHPCWKRQGLAAAADGTVERSRASRRLADTDVEANRDLTRLSVAIRPGGASAEAARRFVAAELARGTQVALLEVRPAPAYEAFVARHDRRDGAFDGLVAPAGAQVWSPPRAAAAQYCDLTHLTPEGQRAFSDWLLVRIAAVAAGARHPSQNAARAVAGAPGIL